MEKFLTWGHSSNTQKLMIRLDLMELILIWYCNVENIQ